MNLTIEIVPGGENCRVVMRGAINEDAKEQLNKLADDLTPGVVFDLGGISYINSCGIREWALFMRALTEKSPIILENCSSEFMQMFNMTISVRDNVEIASFNAPIFCEQCDEERALLLVAGRDYAPGKPPDAASLKCPQCGSANTDDMVEEFFCFLDQ